MIKKLISYVLVSIFSLSSFATVGEKNASNSETASVITALNSDFMNAELDVLKNKHEKIKSWKDLKDTVNSFKEEDKSFLLARINEWEKAPFLKPKFVKTVVGFDLTFEEQKIHFNFQTGTLSYNGKVLSLNGQTLQSIHEWLNQPTSTTSLVSFFINDAHAIAPLVYVIVSFAITSIGMLWNISCKKAFIATERRISDLSGSCNWDLQQNRSSSEIRQLLTEMNSTENSVIRSRGKTCEQQIRDSHRWLFVFSCSENTAGICSKIQSLSNCLTEIKNRGPINDSRLWMDRDSGPVRTSPTRERARRR